MQAAGVSQVVRRGRTELFGKYIWVMCVSGEGRLHLKKVCVLLVPHRGTCSLNTRIPTCKKIGLFTLAVVYPQIKMHSDARQSSAAKMERAKIMIVLMHNLQQRLSVVSHWNNTMENKWHGCSTPGTLDRVLSKIYIFFFSLKFKKAYPANWFHFSV